MLRELKIRNLALIESLHLVFSANNPAVSSSLAVLTGENSKR